MGTRIRLSLFEKLGAGGCLGIGLVALLSLAGYLTHVVVCIRDEKWLLLIGGCIAAPVGAIHGWGVWFGWWG